jgi:hypothetical protein
MELPEQQEQFEQEPYGGTDRGADRSCGGFRFRLPPDPTPAPASEMEIPADLPPVEADQWKVPPGS